MAMCNWCVVDMPFFITDIPFISFACLFPVQKLSLSESMMFTSELHTGVISKPEHGSSPKSQAWTRPDIYLWSLIYVQKPNLLSDSESAFPGCLFWPNFGILASFQVDWPTEISLAFFGFISSWSALKNLFGPLALFWPFYAEKVSSEKKYYYFHFFDKIFAKFFNKSYIRPIPAFWC